MPTRLSTRITRSIVAAIRVVVEPLNPDIHKNDAGSAVQVVPNIMTLRVLDGRGIHRGRPMGGAKHK